MAKYILKRVLQVIPMLLIVSFIVFALIHMAPYDAIDSITTPSLNNLSLTSLE